MVKYEQQEPATTIQQEVFSEKSSLNLLRKRLVNENRPLNFVLLMQHI